MEARRIDEYGQSGSRAEDSAKKATGKAINTVLVMGLGLPTMRALGRLLGKRYYMERAVDATDCLHRIGGGGAVSAVVVDPGVSEFDSNTFASLIRRYNPKVPLFFFGSAQDILAEDTLCIGELTRCFKSPSEICKLAEEIILVSTNHGGTWRPDIPVSKMVVKTLELVEANYSKIGRISEISKSLGVSREHLSRQFTRFTGHTLSDFVTIYRVEKAKELLFAGSLVKQVYSEVGFKCESSFFRSFLKHVGITPRVYRETMLARKREADHKQAMRGGFPES
jgi:AraC-like DNA-binding protein